MKIQTVKELYELVSDTEYGWIDSNNNKHFKLNMVEFREKYILQKPEEVIKNKIGICWDQVELERHYLEKMSIECWTYLIYYEGAIKDRTHTFLVYRNNGYYFWFEHAWKKHKGLHQYQDMDEIFKAVNNIFIKEELKLNCDLKKIHLYQYNKPQFHTTSSEFLNYCREGIEVSEKLQN